MTTDHLSPQSPTWGRADTDAARTIRTEAAGSFRRMAAQERQYGNDTLAESCERMARRLEEIYGVTPCSD